MLDIYRLYGEFTVDTLIENNHVEFYLTLCVPLSLGAFHLEV